MNPTSFVNTRNEQFLFPRKWEEIDEYTDRLKVPGGWLVRSQMEQISPLGRSYSQSMVFVPNVGQVRSWELEEKT